jgi:hypothetical protein
MAKLSLESIYATERIGLLLTRQGELHVDLGLVEAAAEIQKLRDAPFKFEAPSATTAAAWLLCMSGRVYGQDITGFQTLLPENIGWENISVSFRGQAERYDSFVPTWCRGRLSLEDQTFEKDRISWLWLALQLFHDRSFRYDPRNKNETPQFWVGLQETLIVAQHHELRSCFLDWTFDPLVALTFAAYGLKVGERATVFIQGATNSWAILPPTFLRRLWGQSGFVEELPCSSDAQQRASGECKHDFHHASRYHAITFTVANEEELDFFKRHYASLMNTPPYIDRLIEWSRDQAKTRGFADHVGWRMGSVAKIEEELKRLGVDPESVPVQGVVQEDVEQILNVFRQRALRVHQGAIQWSVYALGRCVDAISTDASIKSMDRDYIDALEDPAEKSLFKMMRAGANHLDSVSKSGGIQYQPYR